MVSGTFHPAQSEKRKRRKSIGVSLSNHAERSHLNREGRGRPILSRLRHASRTWAVSQSTSVVEQPTSQLASQGSGLVLELSVGSRTMNSGNLCSSTWRGKEWTHVLYSSSQIQRPVSYSQRLIRERRRVISSFTGKMLLISRSQGNLLIVPR